jgi:hypothetical protein
MRFIVWVLLLLIGMSVQGYAQRLEGKYFQYYDILINSINPNLSKPNFITGTEVQNISDSLGNNLCYYNNWNFHSQSRQLLPRLEKNPGKRNFVPFLHYKYEDKYLVFGSIVYEFDIENNTKVYVYPIKIKDGTPMYAINDSVYIFNRPLEFQNQTIDTRQISYLDFLRTVDQTLNVVRPVNADNFFIYTLRDDERSNINNKIYKLNFNPN